MKKLTILAITVSAIMLTACKTDISAEIPFSGMLSDGIKETTAELKVEVAACEDFEDSRKESNSLVKARDAILQAVPTAKFIECHKEQFYSFATFSLPVNYGQGDFSKVEHISVITEKKDDETLSTTVMVPKTLKVAVDNNQKEKFSINKFELENLKIQIHFKNDTDKSYLANAISSFVGSTPSQAYEIKFEPNTVTEITLSDVSTHLAFSLDGFAHNPLVLTSITEN